MSSKLSFLHVAKVYVANVLSKSQIEIQNISKVVAQGRKCAKVGIEMSN